MTRWYKEEWINLNNPIKKNGKVVGYKKCGRDKINGDEYPLCRPLKKITRYTPKTVKELPKKTIEKARKLKKKIKETGKVKF